MVVIHNRSLQWLYWDLYKDSVPAPIWGPKIRWCIITKNVAACVCGIWDLCKEGLGLKASESSHRYECLLSPPVLSNFEGPSWQISLAKRGTASRKNHWSCNVHQKCLKDGMWGNVSNCYEIESDCFEIFQSQLGNLRILPFECLSCSACGSKKQDAAQIGV